MTTTQIRPQPPGPVARPARRARPWVPLALVLAGVLVLLYPVVVTSYNNLRQQEFAAEYEHDVERTPPTVLRQELRDARAYNRSLEGVPILDPWLTRVSRDPRSKAYRAYLDELSLLDVMARVRVPEVGIDVPVRHGTTDEALAEGAGHLYGTSLPVGGSGTHAVMTSHTGLATATLFDNLSSVEIGDLMYVDVAGRTLAYEVDQIKTVLPSEVSDLTTVDGEDYLTLFTCTPYAVNTHRLLVRGHRVPYDASLPGARTGESPGLHLQRWMWWMIGGAAVGLLLVLVIVVREVRHRRRPAHRPAGVGGPPPPTRAR